jgi:hypothetical protein
MCQEMTIRCYLYRGRGRWRGFPVTGIRLVNLRHLSFKQLLLRGVHSPPDMRVDAATLPTPAAGALLARKVLALNIILKTASAAAPCQIREGRQSRGGGGGVTPEDDDHADQAFPSVVVVVVVVIMAGEAWYLQKLAMMLVVTPPIIVLHCWDGSRSCYCHRRACLYPVHDWLEEHAAAT